MVVTRVHGLPVLEYLNVLNSFDVSKKKKIQINMQSKLQLSASLSVPLRCLSVFDSRMVFNYSRK